MKQEWDNLRTIWNAESKRLGQKALAELVTPPGREKPFNFSYIAKLGRGKNQFTEDILERFSQHMGLELAVLFSTVDQEKLSKEAAVMVEVKECLELMLAIPEFKRGILAHCDLLKETFKEKVAAEKKSTSASNLLK